MVFLDRGWALWGHPETVPDPKLVGECESVLRRLWREGFCHPMYNCDVHRGHREYMLTTEETAWIAPFPSMPLMTSCWTDVEDVNDRIRNAKGRSMEEGDADLRRLQEEVQGRDDAFLGPGAVAPDVRRVLAEGEGPENRLRKLFQGDEETMDHPSHYRKDSGIEAIDVIEAWGLGFNLGNAVKYICRAGQKYELKGDDLEKAVWYLQREIENERKVRKG